MRLRGRTLWLIGASSGIGAALAPELAAAGARLAISARRKDALEEVAEVAAQRGERPLVKPLDVTDADALAAAYKELREEWEALDILFYNAGRGSEGTATLDTAATLELIEVNYLGLVRAVGLVAPDMLARRSGEIVGMGSVAGYAGIPRAAAYSSSKAAVIAYLQALRIEFRDEGVGVTTVNPGFVRTPLTERSRFTMPFLLEAEDAAREIVDRMLDGDSEIHFPRRLTWPAKVVTALPRAAYEYVAGFLPPRGN